MFNRMYLGISDILALNITIFGPVF